MFGDIFPAGKVIYCDRNAIYAQGHIVVSLRDNLNKNGLPLIAEVHFVINFSQKYIIGEAKTHRR